LCQFGFQEITRLSRKIRDFAGERLPVRKTAAYILEMIVLDGRDWERLVDNESFDLLSDVGRGGHK
jgi:hypothetical protein